MPLTIGSEIDDVPPSSATANALMYGPMMSSASTSFCRAASDGGRNVGSTSAR